MMERDGPREGGVGDVERGELTLKGRTKERAASHKIQKNAKGKIKAHSPRAGRAHPRSFSVCEGLRMRKTSAKETVKR